jgi:hypothetical protein
VFSLCDHSLAIVGAISLIASNGAESIKAIGRRCQL